VFGFNILATSITEDWIVQHAANVLAQVIDNGMCPDRAHLFVRAQLH
jgi:hypothetical protein